MSRPHVFVETNFLFGVFRAPSKRNRDALTLKALFGAGAVRLYVPYLCFQEAGHLIANSLRGNRFSDLLDFHRYADGEGRVAWEIREVEKLLDAVGAEVKRTKDGYQRALDAFAREVGDGILHGSDRVFELLQTLELDHNLKYNDKLILSSVLVGARGLLDAGADRVYFASEDKGDLQPTPQRPKLARQYDEAGLVFLPGFVLPEASGPP